MLETQFADGPKLDLVVQALCVDETIQGEGEWFSSDIDASTEIYALVSIFCRKIFEATNNIFRHAGDFGTLPRSLVGTWVSPTNFGSWIASERLQTQRWPC